MSTLVDIPGVGEVEFPDSMSRAEIQAAAKRLHQGKSKPQGPGIGESFQRSALEGVLGNIAAVPRMALQGSGLFTPSAHETLLGVEDPTDINLPNIPTPSGQQALSGILAGAKTGMGVLQGSPSNLGENYQNSMAASEQSRTANPIASASGDALADAMTILAGRAPFVKAPKSAKVAAQYGPGFKRFAQKVWNTPAVQKLARGAGRSAEAGLEGAALSILKDGDPLETAAYAAGGQAAGSMALQLADFAGVKDIARGELFKGVGKLSLAAILTGSAMQFMDTAIPGDKNWLIENLESGYDKVLLAMLAGAGAGMAGAGRIHGENFPIIADAITALPRGAITSLWEEYARDDDAKRAIDLLQKAPKAHTESQINALEQGMFEEGSFSERVRKLLEEDEEYRAMWEAPDPRLAGVPLKD